MGIRGTRLAIFVLLLSATASDIGAQTVQDRPSPRAAAGLDLTGTWVSVVTEDWRYRMMTPPKGDYASVPLTAEARKVADAWDPARDEAAAEQCRSYGAPTVMRMPGRVRIAWEDDDTLKVETEAGAQTRLLDFTGPPRRGPVSWQGSSLAQWVYSSQAARGGARRGHLKVVTTNLRQGYLRKNGVPYSPDAVLTEYYNRLDEPNGDVWLIVTTMVDDPRYLTGRFATSTHFKKLPAGDTRWTPERCSSR